MSRAMTIEEARAKQKAARINAQNGTTSAQPATNLPPMSTIDNMERHGGGFVRKLAAAYVVADSENKQKLAKAFPDEFARYDANFWGKKL